MIANDRYLKILNLLDEKQSITINEIVEFLNTSESTVRRDLSVLDKEKKLIKVHGGAISNKRYHITKDQNIYTKQFVNVDEKRIIAKKAASIITEKDFVFIDAGSTTYQMIEFITEKKASYMTNSVSIAKALADKNFNVIVLGGKIKENTQAIIGTYAIDYLKKFNFTLGFLGVNGVDIKSGYTTPDIEEANLKKVALKNSHKAFILCDSSKISLVSSVTFASLKDAYIITTKVNDEEIFKEIKKHTNVLEV